MTTKLKSERLWRSIERYVELKAGRVGVRQLARRFKLAASNVSRGLRARTQCHNRQPEDSCMEVLT